MSKKVLFHPLFDCDIREAADWYDQRTLGLGDAFVATSKETVQKIIENPQNHSSTDIGIRYRKMSRFPYIVLFDVVDDELLMLGVLHTARSIDKWREARG